MSGSTISTTISTYVYVGSGSYASPLTITNTGAVVGLTPPGDSFGHSAIRDTDATGTIINHGVLIGSGSETLLMGASGVFMGAGSLFNDGTIEGGYAYNLGGAGVTLDDGSVSNAGTIVGGSATIIGGSGVSLDGGAFNNRGSINGGSASSSGGTGLSINTGYAENTGRITGGAGDNAGGVGVYLTGGTFINSGLVVGGYGDSVSGTPITDRGGYVENSGTIETARLQDFPGVKVSTYQKFNAGGYYGPSTAGTFVNRGYDIGGVYLARGSTLLNYGTISGGVLVFADYTSVKAVQNDGYIAQGIRIAGGDQTVVNGGIIGSAYGPAVYFTNPNARYAGARLIVDPGSSFNGLVVSDQSASALELATGTATGTIADLGDGITGFETIAFDAGASWLVESNLDGLARGETITGFDKQDTLELYGFTATSDTYVTGTGLVLSDGIATETLDIVGNFSTSSFIVSDFTVETFIELCYLRGTRIATPAGEVAVEALGIGDAVITRFGGYRRIKWIGRQSFGRRFIQNQREQIPVRIRASALAPSLPKRDLFVSPGHSMLLGDVLVLARHLINGVTITQDACPDEVHYYQVEFETHDCVLAEGVWSESFCDYAGLRNQFHNVSEFHALYPAHVTPAEHLMCAPRPEAGPALAAALGPVVARAGACTTAGPLRGWIDNVDTDGNVAGWALDTTNPELPMKLEILLHGRVIGGVLACDYREDLAIAKIGRGRCGFNFNAGAIARRSLSTLQVRRVADEAVIPMSPNCLTEIGATPRRKRA